MILITIDYYFQYFSKSYRYVIVRDNVTVTISVINKNKNNIIYYYNNNIINNNNNNNKTKKLVIVTVTISRLLSLRYLLW